MRSAWLTLLLVASAAQALAAGPEDCRTKPYVRADCYFNGRCAPLKAAPCFWVTGRLGFANGAPAVRLRPRGAHRLLGVVGGDGDAASPKLLPRNVDALSTPPTPGDRRDLWGRFRVCPLATEKPGWMRPVCIAQAEDLSVLARDPN